MTSTLERPAEAVPRRDLAAGPGQPGARSSRIGGLDGLRAIAVAAVVVYHLGMGWLPGGFLGVDLFFVISGFLITTLLLAEIERSGRIRYGRFYLRRAKRLLPALFLMLLGALSLAAAIARDAALPTLRDVPGALLYISNWWALGTDQSYFEIIGRGSLLGHLWSLAVEEQFYLVWPLLLGGIALVSRGRLRLGVLITAGIAALISTAWMATFAVQHEVPLGTDPTRVYFGTDTHAMSVLAGAALAAVWNVSRFRADVVPGARRVLLGAGVAGLALSALLMLTITEYTSWLYRGGFLVTSLVFALVVASATHPASPLGPALDNPVMRWVGARSYGIYLFHWPIFLVTRPGLDVGQGWLVNAARVTLVLVVADLSYRYVEVPIRRGTFGTWWLDRRVLVAALAATCALAAALATAPRAAEVAVSRALGPTADVVDGAPVDGQEAVAAPAVQTAWYGDSVMLWTVDALREAFPGARVDAGINRAPTNIMSRVRADAPMSGVVVMHLGNAGPVPGRELSDTLTALADAERVVLVNSNATFPYVAQANATLAAVAGDFPNVTLVDWQALSSGRSEWFTDGLHLTDEGQAAFVTAVREAMAA